MQHPNDRPDKLGVVTHGSLSKGVAMKLAEHIDAEDITAGTFVVVQGTHFDFFSLITDVTIDATNESIRLYPPAAEEHLLRQVVRGMGAYTTVDVRPMLMMDNRDHPELSDQEAHSVKTIPSHFSPVARADRDDVARVFGAESHEDGQTYFQIGSPRGMDDIPLCVNLRKLVERSNAVFGKTGTGKTFLTRLLLCGTIFNDAAVNLIFDMHSEYASTVHHEGKTGFLKGLKELFDSRVSIYTLDPEHARQSGHRPDGTVYLYADQIEPNDILPLTSTFNLTSTAVDSCYALKRRYGTLWLTELLKARADEMGELAESIGAHEQSLKALHRRLSRLKEYRFFKTTPRTESERDVLEDFLETIDSGRHIVLEFGNYTELTAYLLVANVFTRRIRARYEQKSTEYRRKRDKSQQPRQLIITIEEAHKFLAPGIARETPFGKIAREMRKFFVSLLIVDQRPSAIDEEVLSQIGTKFVCQLNDEKDIGATLAGESTASGLRNILASIDGKQQALILGHAIPMPIVIRTRNYDDQFFRIMRGNQTLDEQAYDLVQG
ncbi:MAG: ATP-binding protein [Bacteroidota bacterium]|nr:ATP-binding protein [Bacteroidota bacterium]